MANTYPTRRTKRAEKEEVKRPRLCSDCRHRTEWREVTQEYERNGLRVRLAGLPAMVCPHCGSISFPPGVAHKIVTAVNAFFALLEDRHRGALRVDPAR